MAFFQSKDSNESFNSNASIKVESQGSYEELNTTFIKQFDALICDEKLMDVKIVENGSNKYINRKQTHLYEKSNKDNVEINCEKSKNIPKKIESKSTNYESDGRLLSNQSNQKVNQFPTSNSIYSLVNCNPSYAPSSNQFFQYYPMNYQNFNSYIPCFQHYQAQYQPYQKSIETTIPTLEFFNKSKNFNDQIQILCSEKYSFIISLIKKNNKYDELMALYLNVLKHLETLLMNSFGFTFINEIIHFLNDQQRLSLWKELLMSPPVTQLLVKYSDLFLIPKKLISYAITLKEQSNISSVIKPILPNIVSSSNLVKILLHILVEFKEETKYALFSYIFTNFPVLAVTDSGNKLIKQFFKVTSVKPASFKNEFFAIIKNQISQILNNKIGYRTLLYLVKYWKYQNVLLNQIKYNILNIATSEYSICFLEAFIPILKRDKQIALIDMILTNEKVISIKLLDKDKLMIKLLSFLIKQMTKDQKKKLLSQINNLKLNNDKALQIREFINNLEYNIDYDSVSN